MTYRKYPEFPSSNIVHPPGQAREKAFFKIKQFCAYQERAHREVMEKLYTMGLRKNDVEALLVQLIEENYLNEERFAKQFALGKFRIKHWGRIKISYELKQKQVGEYCIRKALAEIDEETYMATLRKLADKKRQSLKSEKNILVRKRKIRDFLLQKGFESQKINVLLHDG